MIDIKDIWIVIPVGKREQYLQNILNKLHKHKNRIVFINNATGYSKFDGVHHVEDFQDINIYRWWNKGIKYAQDNGAKYVAILNDDIDFNDLFIENMFKHMISRKAQIVDTGNSGNGGGAAWGIDVDCELRLDERFKWWYGDTLIFNQAKKRKIFCTYFDNSFKHLEANKQLLESELLQDFAWKQDNLVYEQIKKSKSF